MDWDYYDDSVGDFDQTVGGGGGTAGDQVTHAYVEVLEGKIDTLALACQALWEILRDRTKLTDDELSAKMEEVDLRDGNNDGKISPVAKPCPACGRKTSRRRAKCIYCGKDASGGSEIFARK